MAKHRRVIVGFVQICDRESRTHALKLVYQHDRPQEREVSIKTTDTLLTRQSTRYRPEPLAAAPSARQCALRELFVPARTSSAAQRQPTPSTRGQTESP